MLASVWNTVGIMFGLLLIVIMFAFIVIIVQSVFSIGGNTNEKNEKEVHRTGNEVDKRN